MGIKKNFQTPYEVFCEREYGDVPLEPHPPMVFIGPLEPARAWVERRLDGRGRIVLEPKVVFCQHCRGTGVIVQDEFRDQRGYVIIAESVKDCASCVRRRERRLETRKTLEMARQRVVAEEARHPPMRCQKCKERTFCASCSHRDCACSKSCICQSNGTPLRCAWCQKPVSASRSPMEEHSWTCELARFKNWPPFNQGGEEERRQAAILLWGLSDERLKDTTKAQHLYAATDKEAHEIFTSVNGRAFGLLIQDWMNDPKVKEHFNEGGEKT